MLLHPDHRIVELVWELVWALARDQEALVRELGQDLALGQDLELGLERAP